MSLKIIYNQRDLKWANHIYSATPPHTETVQTSGCGITSAAMIISNLTDTIITPDVMADYSIKNGFRVDGIGTSFSLFPAIAKKYNLNCVQASDINQAIECVNNGGLVICSTNGGITGLFSTGGHLFVLSNEVNGRCEFVDPDLYPGKYNTSYRRTRATVENDRVYVNKDVAKVYITTYFCFSKIEIEEEKVMIYDYIDDNMPDWARESVQWAVDNGVVKGSESGLGLDDKDLKVITFLYRANLLK